MHIDDTLKARGSLYGSFQEQASMTQALLEVLAANERFADLPAVHKEALHMILHKIARMVCGDPFYWDTVHDIGGYAKLLEEYIKKVYRDDMG